MKPIHAMTCAGLVMAGVTLSGCSDNDKGFRDYPTFPGIESQETGNKRAAHADLSGDSLKYQAALLYEVVLNDRAFDDIDRPVDEPLGTRDCAVDGFLYHGRGSRQISTRLGSGAMNVSQVLAYGCTVQVGTTERMTLGQFNVARNDLPCAGDPGLCDISYSSYGDGYYTYGVQYLTAPGAGIRNWDRVEIRGYTVDGPRKVDVGGTIETAAEQRHNLLVATSVATLDGNTVDTERVYSLQYGAGDGYTGTPFVLQRLSGNRRHLEGLLSSGAMGTNCTGGRFTVETDTLLTVDGSNIVAGSLTLESGSGAGAQSATLNFQALTGNVELVTGGGTVTLTRSVIQDLRDECFRTVAVQR